MGRGTLPTSRRTKTNRGRNYGTFETTRLAPLLSLINHALRRELIFPANDVGRNVIVVGLDMLVTTRCRRNGPRPTVGLRRDSLYTRVCKCQTGFARAPPPPLGKEEIELPPLLFVQSSSDRSPAKGSPFFSHNARFRDVVRFAAEKRSRVREEIMIKGRRRIKYSLCIASPSVAMLRKKTILRRVINGLFSKRNSAKRSVFPSKSFIFILSWLGRVRDDTIVRPSMTR